MTLAASTEAPHNPVLLQEMLEFMAPAAGEVYVDATFGAGGYSRALLQAAECRVVGIDRDPDAAPAAEALSQEFSGRFSFFAGAFGAMAELLRTAEIQRVEGIVLDIGVSSMQLDQAQRGFSFSHDGPLDMRMAQTGRSARDVVNEATEEELADIFFHYGEEKAARKVARAIVTARLEKPIERTRELAEIVRSAVQRYYGKKSTGADAATRSFQGLRIYVNDELGELERALNAAVQLLAPGGRLVVVVFHSLEDRIVKRFFAEITGNAPGLSRHIPYAGAMAVPEYTLLTRKPVLPSEMEMQSNPRARSAKLRALKRKEAA